jgi:hypothetical protein
VKSDVVSELRHGCSPAMGPTRVGREVKCLRSKATIRGKGERTNGQSSVAIEQLGMLRQAHFTLIASSVHVFSMLDFEHLAPARRCEPDAARSSCIADMAAMRAIDDRT